MELFLGGIIGQTEHAVFRWPENFEFADRLISKDSCTIPHLGREREDSSRDLLGGRRDFLGRRDRKGQNREPKARPRLRRVERTAGQDTSNSGKEADRRRRWLGCQMPYSTDLCRLHKCRVERNAGALRETGIHDLNNFSTVVRTYSELLLSELPRLAHVRRRGRDPACGGEHGAVPGAGHPVCPCRCDATAPVDVSSGSPKRWSSSAANIPAVRCRCRWPRARASWPTRCGGVM